LTPSSGPGRFSPIPVPYRGIPRRGQVAATTHDKIQEVLDAIRPAIQADGGDVEFLAYREDDGIVEVRLLGACESCPISMMTLKEGIERRIKSSVPNVVEVTAL
jgi:Fe-S cluster biogenesis protein NfuA